MLVLLESSDVLPGESLELSSGWDGEEFGVFLLLLALLLLLFIDSHKLMFRLEVALEGIKRSEVPMSAAVGPFVRRRIGRTAALPKLLCELDALDKEKLYFLGEPV